MKKINETGRGQNNVDHDAAIAVHSQLSKKDLEESPFVVTFELGENNEGYWTCNTDISTQFEDCIDCIKVMWQCSPND